MPFSGRLADLPMSFCDSFAPRTPQQLLPSAAVAERSPCTAQRSGGGATSDLNLLQGALFHNALSINA
jgi:hypothetical protein